MFGRENYTFCTKRYYAAPTLLLAYSLSKVWTLANSDQVIASSLATAHSSLGKRYVKESIRELEVYADALKIASDNY